MAACRSGIAVLLLSAAAVCQTQATGQYSPGRSSSGSFGQSGSNSIGIQLPAAGAYSGSVPEGKATGTVLELDFTGAIDRGLRNNLGLLLESDNTLAARGARWQELSALLPNVSAQVSENAAQINLQAMGLKFPGFPIIIGPYGFSDARAYLSQSVFDWSNIQRARASYSNERAAQFSYKDARELVVVAVGNAYLQALAGASRVETAQAQVETAQALLDKSVAQQTAGVSPAIDTLRSRVELQSRQQQLIFARNNFAKQKLQLARVIGLPPGQEFQLTEKTPYAPLATMTADQTLQRAYAFRSDYQAAIQSVRSAQLFRSAASAQRYPSLNINGNYGDIGTNFGNSHGTFEVTGALQIPIFAGGRVHADVLQAEARLKQAQQQLDNLRGQIDYEVRTALLDLAAAADQVEVARSSVDLAGQTLTQARDRFAAGVTDNLEVIQAQEAVASANENLISSLYSHNLAKVELARAIGYAEQGVKQYLKSR